MTVASNLGFPRIGHRRELKVALEQFWSGSLNEAGLEDAGRTLRQRHWHLQVGHGISHVPSGEFSFYDRVLDTACMLGAIPSGYGWQEGPVSLATYFALARGSRGTEAEQAAGVRSGMPVCEMTKWFDTNYHYLVPRVASGQRFSLTENRPLKHYKEAEALSLRTRPVLLGPVSFLMLSKSIDGSDPLDLLGAVLPVYSQILRGLAEANVAWVQMDEPMLSMDLPEKANVAFGLAYGALRQGAAPSILLANHFGPLGDNLRTALSLPVEGLHVDVVRGGNELQAVADATPADRWLSLGLIDGRNVWRTDLRAALTQARQVEAARGTRRLMVAPSCSLLHVPVDLRQEGKLAPSIKDWLAFAEQKLAEVSTLARGLDEGDEAITAQLEASDAAVRSRAGDKAVNKPAVRTRVAETTPVMEQRASRFPDRRIAQQARFGLPLFPTTTIGSFPQTAAVRDARAAHARGQLTPADYQSEIANWVDEAVRWQEEIGIDVLVHGEFERNDMVKYFGEQLGGLRSPSKAGFNPMAAGAWRRRSSGATWNVLRL